MKIESTLNSFQQKNKVVELTPKQKMKASGGGVFQYVAPYTFNNLNDNNDSEDVTILLKPIAFFR